MEQVLLVRGYAADAFIVWLILIGLLILIFASKLIMKYVLRYLNRKVMTGWPFE